MEYKAQKGARAAGGSAGKRAPPPGAVQGPPRSSSESNGSRKQWRVWTLGQLLRKGDGCGGQQGLLQSKPGTDLLAKCSRSLWGGRAWRPGRKAGVPGEARCAEGRGRPALRPDVALGAASVQALRLL